MKKIIYYFIAGILLIGCVSVNQKMNKSMGGVYNGMSIQEFKSQIPKSTLVEMLENFACYKLEHKTAQFGTPGGYVYARRFFYFKDNQLYKIDEGERATDLKIEIQKSVDVTNH